MRNIGFSLVELATGTAVWSGSLPARVELRDGDGAVTVRADFDRAGLVVPEEDAPTHRMVERVEIEAPDENAVRGVPNESFDGELIIVDPQWTEPAP
jgi:hypothetical protein